MRRKQRNTENQTSYCFFNWYLKYRLNPQTVIVTDPTTGEILDEVTVGGSTKRMSVVAFSDYVTMAEALATELGIRIPAGVNE